MCLLNESTKSKSTSYAEFRYDSNADEYFKVMEYLDELGHLESSGRYEIKKGQYWGKYQLGESARKDINLHISFKEYSTNSEIQDVAVLRYLLKNERYLRNTIPLYEGTEIDGVVLTRESMLAGAHLVGYTKLRDYLHSNGTYIPEDGNGTPIIKYLTIFQKYNGLNFLAAKEYIIKQNSDG